MARVCQHPETAWRRLGPLIACSLALLVQGTAKLPVNSQTCSALAFQAAGQDVAGVVPVVPVAEPVGGLAPGDRLVVALPQAGEQVRVEVIAAGGDGGLDGGVRLLEDLADVLCPALPVMMQFVHAFQVAR